MARQYDETLLSDMKDCLRNSPRTIPEMAGRFSRGERTIIRWIQELRKRGYRIVKDGPETNAPYYIPFGEGIID